MNIFRRRKARSHSIPDSAATQSPHSAERRLSMPESAEAETGSSILLNGDEYDISSVVSHPLSETETLNNDRRAHFELQDTFYENFDNYLPYVLRRLRLSALAQREDDVPDRRAAGVAVDDDDMATVLDEPLEATGPQAGFIMNKSVGNYNYKRSMVLATEFLKSNVYIFPSEASFQLFRQLRAEIKKTRKNSVVVYENDGSVKTVKSTRVSADQVVDSRPHIVPIENKLAGEGLPLFKLIAPYMSSFRKNAPYLLINRYIESPQRPADFDVETDTNEYETYTYCTVHTKKFGEVRRYTMCFTPADGEPFKILIFQHNFKPFADFNYQGTRFRVLGTPIASAYGLNYNPMLRVLIIDPGKPSLCDNIINRKPGFDIASLLKRRKSSSGNLQIEAAEDLSQLEPEEYPNPYPAPDHPLLNDLYFHFTNGANYTNIKDYIPNNLPPFGGFQDSLVYDETSGLIPKKYNEVGKIELYQDSLSLPRDIHTNSTKSVDRDNLVLTCILATLRENNIRSTARPSSASFALSNRIGPVGSLRYPSVMGDMLLTHPSTSLPM